MFDAIQEVLVALWHQDFNTLLSPGSATLIYIIVAVLISLESGFLPAAPLPCDSVVILVGTLSAVGVLSPEVAFPLLIASASVGSWAAFMQGRWLNKLPMVQRWLKKVPEKNMQTVDALLRQHGLVALFAARFIPGVRSIVPMMMGIRVQEAPRFQYFSWLSAVIWVFLLAGFGFVLPSLPETLSRIVTMGLMAAPLVTLCVAILTAITWRIRKQMRVNKQHSAEA
ncbi:DedA family protein [Grimontia hollisae]|uniref:DedA protein n=2 Tax=Grimontia hollisae TaxID=673 RepID=D0I9S1_GRIHO|nr:DedA family protein [Grimontia hollisae]AMG28992.1 DedA family protein [Grimontia hollisae]EEY71786.1 DedA protein [Grimontia hollisae CIP 101886]MDF2184804.1 DedA family protein [Grimontia hollisae]STO77108.1 Inner membrane protein YghB [Grimontia hollisae]STO98296.1 Inner membrane protein YghB [Grimontia hollisae]